MDRLFRTNEIRKKTTLDGMWSLSIKDKGDFSVSVPGCWEQIPSLSSFRGKGIYTKKVRTAKKTNLRITFKGVSHTGDVYFDDKFIAHHYNAFTPFSAIIRACDAGEHEVKVLVDNTFGEHSSLHVPNDYYTYGGLTRPVTLEEIPDTYIEYVHFTPEFTNGKWSAKIEVCVSNIADYEFCGDISCTIDKTTLSSDVKVPAGETALVSLESSFDGVEPWNTKTPNLYLLNTVLSEKNMPVDDLIERVGFRTVEVKGKKIYLNGEEIYFKGFNRHEDHPLFGCALPLQVMAHDMDLMLDTGANAVRMSHYPNDERFLDMCDERGVLVWEENHARGLSLERMQNPNFDKQCEDCIAEMVVNHYNHPSIVIWGLLNECASHTEEGREKYKKQFEQLRKLDSSRPKSFATCQHFTDLCLDLPDIVSVNLYPLWYDNNDPLETLNKELDWVKETIGDTKPYIVSEFGAGAVYGNRSDTCARWTEERQEQILDSVLDRYLASNELSGLFIWQFSDCRVTEEEWFMVRPLTRNNKGIVDGYRRKKLAYNTVKKHYSKER